MSGIEPEVQAVVVQPVQQAAVSKTTRAYLKETSNALEKTKDSLIRDMSTQRLEPEVMLQEIVNLQTIQLRIDELTESLAVNAVDEFTPRDVETMREMKKTKPETEIADLFDTNQSKVNRLLNSPKS